MARPDLHKLLLDQVPSNKILYGKKILRIEQNPIQVTIHCNDDSMYHGSLLIGADGAYSKVRKSLYEQMEAQGVQVPKTDTQSLIAWHRSVLGVTEPLDPERYPVVKEPGTRYESVVGDNKPNTVGDMGRRLRIRLTLFISRSIVAILEYHRKPSLLEN
jgi:2-polyprenyl-6-methoxyphenol hydroxylase-like FAD-dependent oxidoreductase